MTNAPAVELLLPPPPRRPWKPWVRGTTTVLLIAAIGYWLGPKMATYWAIIEQRAGTISKPLFAVSAVMFALFLFGVRALSWRRILIGLGHRLPVPAAVRIWSTSELARYVPGAVLQVAGRVYLARPYGVGVATCAASQVLELAIFLLANILVGVGCLAFYGVRNVHGAARVWMIALSAVVPLLALMLHPRIFYGAIDAAMRRLGKPATRKRLPANLLFKLLLWAVLGLLWQSVALYLIVARPLGLQPGKWYVVAGSYCLAWCAGFLVVVSPAGIGVREPVFVLAMQFALPPNVRHAFSNKGQLDSLLLFLSGLIRLWTVAGELILAAVAYGGDYRGALGRVRQQPVDAAEL